jgi:hypothetical protein
MQRIALSVPTQDEAHARELGAIWDARRRRWFVPENGDATPFARWLVAADPPNIRSDSYFIAATTRHCGRCRGPSPVCGFALPAGHETLYVDDDSGEVSWERAEDPTFVCYLDYLAPSVAARMTAFSATYRYGYRRRTESFYWVNICAYCGVKLGDYDTFCEPGQGFMPVTRDEAAAISLCRIDAPFIASAGGWSLGVELFDFMAVR